MIYIFTGQGKGKTTAAIGMGIRALGAGLQVSMIQFLKPEGVSSELKVLRRLKNFSVQGFGRKGFFLPISQLKSHPELKKQGVKPLNKIDVKLAEEAFFLAGKIVREGHCQLLILDEIIIAVQFGLLSKKDVLNFLKRFKSKLDIVLTGRNCPRAFLKLASVATRMQEIKHCYKRGQKARKGIEY